jgi:ferric enterobactin receptor
LKKLTFTLLLSFLTLISYAQFGLPGGAQGSTIKGKIKGILIDSISGETLPFASLTLKKEKTTAILDGILSDENGKWSFENVKTGKYEITISFLGYNDKTIKNIETTGKNPDVDLGKVLVSSSAVALQGVEVKANRSLIENKVDRLVFNAENDASIAGGNATDVLRKVPLLTVDMNGNVSMRGSSNVRILINGKPSGMFSSNVADALKMFPADQIKKVEVITAPSSKYDAEGSGGIINIITSKSNIEGIAGSVNASAGTRQNSLFTSLNAGKGRLGSSASGAVFYMLPSDGVLTFLREEIDPTSGKKSIFKQAGTQSTSRLGANGNASLFYDFNAYHAINTSFNFRGFGFGTDGVTSGDMNDQIRNITDTYTRKNDGDNLQGGFDWNTDYTMKFEKHKDRELSMAFQYSKENNDQNQDLVETHTVNTLLNRDAIIKSDGDNHEYTYQMDYTHPLKRGNKLELGGKMVRRNIISDYTNQVKNGEGVYVALPLLSDLFDYHQNVMAGYASFSYVLAKKYNIIAGARYEHTAIDGDFKKSDAASFDNSYQNLLPNFTISRNLKNFRSIKVSYSQRIQRPSLAFINPFNNNADFFNRTIGNPKLNPELTQQVDLTYNTNFKGFTIFSSVYYKHAKDIIEQTIRVENGVSINSFQNIGQNNAVGLNIFTMKNIKKITLRTGGNIFTYNANGVINGQNLSRQTYEYNLFVNGEYTISGSLKADMFGFFKSPTRTLQGDNPSFSIYGLGLRKEFKNSSIGFNVIEPHTANKNFNTNVKGLNFTQASSFSLPFRSIGINYRYKFGSVDFKERSSKVKNTDLKTDGNGQQGSGTPAAGSPAQR